MMYEAEHLAQILERPLKTQALIGSPITITMSPDCLRALATAIQALGGAVSEDFSKEQIQDVMRIILARTSLFRLVKVWALIRFYAWVGRP
jgi:hypothetical protein